MGKEKKRKEDRKRGEKKIKKRKKKERRREEENREPEETYELRETDSTLKGFAKQYTIEGREGVDADTFLDTFRPLVINLLMKNTQKKVCFIL